MINSFESGENLPLSEQEVIDLLDAHDFEASESIAVMSRYADQCHLETDKEVSESSDTTEVAPHRANIKAEVKIALVYFKSQKYKEKGFESLNDALFTASQNEMTADLAQWIVSLMESQD